MANQKQIKRIRKRDINYQNKYRGKKTRANEMINDRHWSNLSIANFSFQAE